jgi:hypothetical protein
MSTPRSNGRSLDSDHVETVCNSVIYNEYGIIAKEDFALSPYLVVSSNSTENDDGGPFIYTCILNIV